MARQINYRMRVTLNDGRQMTGQMLAFDKVVHLYYANVLCHANWEAAYESRPCRYRGVPPHQT